MAKKKAKNTGEKKNKVKNIESGTVKTDSKALKTPSTFIIEDKIKIFLAVILILLFLGLFVSVAWYFVSQVDAALVNGTASIHSIL